MPDGDILPDPDCLRRRDHNIGNNYLHPNPVHPEPIYMAGPDLVAAVIQQPGKIPEHSTGIQDRPFREAARDASRKTPWQSSDRPE